jgi:hypothetical protein
MPSGIGILDSGMVAAFPNCAPETCQSASGPAEPNRECLISPLCNNPKQPPKTTMRPAPFYISGAQCSSFFNSTSTATQSKIVMAASNTRAANIKSVCMRALALSIT